MEPLISIIIPTYNRSNTIERTIKSILNQSYTNYEIIVIDDGSMDNTTEVLSQFKDNRIRLFRHPSNKGVTAAKNTGLNNIKGEWFTVVDSDDEIVPDALECLINIPLKKDNTITKLTCNGIHTATNKYSGLGVDRDQYLDEKTVISKLDGDFWGITKTVLLGNDRFNEHISGYENILWYKIYAKARIYYLHKALLIIHTENTDRLTQKKKNIDDQSKLYAELKNESFYLDKIEINNPKYLNRLCISAIIYLSANGNKKDAQYYSNRLEHFNKSNYYLTRFILYVPSNLIKWMIKQWSHWKKKFRS